MKYSIKYKKFQVQPPRSGLDDMECELGEVNFKGVSDQRRGLWTAFRDHGISDERSRSCTAVKLISLATPLNTEENISCIYKSMGAPATSLGVLITRMVAAQSTGDQCSCIHHKPGSASDKLQSISTQCRAVQKKQHLLCTLSWYAWKSQLLLLVHPFSTIFHSVCMLISESI